MAKSGIYLGCFILILIQNMVAANPLFNRNNVQELENLKDLIHQLEERVAVNEEPEVYPESEDMKMDAEEEDAGISPGALRQSEENLLMNIVDRIAPESPLRSRFRDLAGLAKTAKSFNSCFGTRMDRIGSWSGLGCNSLKNGTKKKIFGN
uniref:Ventricular natriuretic peptide n=1 Tax=Anguilla japonica TaxID=7937 RepID=ANFV_ANGJA|nr:RecName: Full=Ventricular natriuretic peptide; Short=VNP; Flags: Precursor [Anguilla japonica]BAA34121.1 ventricular natriuretic peptide [Anguilla japonica]prf//2101262A ventricular natriuretic peptide [Anguilla japonica]